MEDLNKDDLLVLLEWYSSLPVESDADKVLAARITARIEQLQELEDFMSDCGDACKL